MQEVDESSHRQYTKQVFDNALAGLSQNQARAVRRYYIDGLTMAGIAQERGVVIETVRRYIHRGTRALRGNRELWDCYVEYIN